MVLLVLAAVVTIALMGGQQGASGERRLGSMIAFGDAGEPGGLGDAGPEPAAARLDHGEPGAVAAAAFGNGPVRAGACRAGCADGAARFGRCVRRPFGATGIPCPDDAAAGDNLQMHVMTTS